MTGRLCNCCALQMVALALAVVVALSSCVPACCSGNTHSTEVTEKKPPAAAVQEFQAPECDEERHDREAVAQKLESNREEAADKEEEEAAGTVTGGEDHEEEDGFSSSEEAHGTHLDPCFHYTVLDQAWRGTNTSTQSKMCDRHVKWAGWYRLFYNGRSLQMPERCVPVNKCGTHAPLWLAGPHPRRRDGVVTLNVCGHWKDKCCAFLSTPIQVKKCSGNYFVYKFTQPSACYLAYCADVNTLVCGQCSRYELCVSRDKINWRCKKKNTIPVKVHFFASFPAPLTGKVKRIKYSRVLVNTGRAFDRRSGVFRAPVRGVYQFFFSTQASGGGPKTDLWLVVNDYWVAVSRTLLPRGSGAGGLSTYMTLLNRGAAVYVTQDGGRSWADAASVTITFGGSLLAQWRESE